MQTEYCNEFEECFYYRESAAFLAERAEAERGGVPFAWVVVALGAIGF